MCRGSGALVLFYSTRGKNSSYPTVQSFGTPLFDLIVLLLICLLFNPRNHYLFCYLRLVFLLVWKNMIFFFREFKQLRSFSLFLLKLNICFSSFFPCTEKSKLCSFFSIAVVYTYHLPCSKRSDQTAACRKEEG